MGITLYGILPSPPSHTARLMLELKGLDHRKVWLLPGIHPALVRAQGFRGGTVPAMKVDGRRIQGSREISRTLEELKPDPPLFPSDPERRIEVEEAERWGDLVFQDVPRRIVRWLAVHRPETKVMIARDVGVPLPRVAALLNTPAARHLANKVDATDAVVSETIAGVPEVLDHIDGLIADEVIGGDRPNAADLQIATSLRVLLTIEDLRPAFAGRPAVDLATRLLPKLGNDFPSGLLPAEWLKPLEGARSTG